MKLMNLASFIATGLIMVNGVYAEGKEGALYKANKEVSGQGYGPAGCGLGSVVIGSKPGFTQVFAATTNGSSGSQTFGITSGTSNCEDSRTAMLKVDAFVANNQNALKTDAARGNGETVASLAQILGCSESAALGSELQKNFNQIFTQHSNDQIGTSIVQDVRTSSDLACSNI